VGTEALENSLSALNFVLNFSIGAVVLGLVLEYAPEFWNTLHNSRWKRIEHIGAVLVVVGVAGELLLHIRSEQIDNQLKSIQRTAIVQLFDRATAAEKATALANERAATAEKAASEAKLALAKMNAPRVLTVPAANKLVATFRPYAGKTFWVITEKNAPDVGGEQELVANQIIDVFNRAGWRKDSHWSRLDATKIDPEFAPVSNRGCGVDSSGDTTSLALRKVIVDALTEAGIDCQTSVGPELIAEHIVIEVGLR
jgi:hypothetical protein